MANHSHNKLSTAEDVRMSGECETFQLILPVIIVGVTCVVGFVGNVLSIVVLRKEPCHPVTAFLLTALAVTDFIMLVPIFVLMVPGGLCEYRHIECPSAMRALLPHLEKYGWALASMAHMNTVYVTLFVTVHRYIFVCHPHAASRKFTIQRAKVLVLVMALFAVLYNIPRFYEFDVVKVDSNSTNSSTLGDQNMVRRSLTHIGKNLYFQVIYKNVFYFLIMYIFPLTTISILSIKLVQALRRQRQRVSKRTKLGRKKDDNITFVLIIIIAIFIVCQTPTAIQRLMYLIFGEAGAQCGHFFFYFEPIADYFAVVNSCVNFVIYIFFARRFRQTLCHMMSTCICCGGRGSLTSEIPMEDFHARLTADATIESMSHNGIEH